MLSKHYLYFCLTLILFLSQLFGFWPYYYDRSKKIFHTNQCIILYPIVIVVSVLVLNIIVINELTLNFHIDRVPPLARFVSGFAIISALYFIPIIFFIQYLKLNKLNVLFQRANILLIDLWKYCNLQQIKYTKQLFIFTIRIFLINIIIVYCGIFHVTTIAPQEFSKNYWRIFVWILPTIIMTILPDVYFTMFLIFHFGYQQINRSISNIMIELRLLNFGQEGINERKYLRMKKFCDLSDQLDKVAIIHFRLSSIVVEFNQCFSIQMIIWTIYLIQNTLGKSFMEYLTIVMYVLKKKSFFYIEMDLLFFCNIVVILMYLLSITSVTKACSKTLSEVKQKQLKRSYNKNCNLNKKKFQAHKTSEILHGLCVHNEVDVRFKRSVNIQFNLIN